MSSPLYCCFVPDLTGFERLSFALGLSIVTTVSNPESKTLSSRVGIRPCYSGLQVQGAATSPLSTLYYRIFSLFCKYAFAGFLCLFILATKFQQKKSTKFCGG